MCFQVASAHQCVSSTRLMVQEQVTSTYRLSQTLLVQASSTYLPTVSRVFGADPVWRENIAA
jgi:hypothetical protein